MVTRLWAVRPLLIATLLAGLLHAVSACGSKVNTPQTTSATTTSDGQARVESSSGVVEFTATSGLTGERQPGIRISVSVVGENRLFYASDPTDKHLPVAGPLNGEATIRRLTLPPDNGRHYNLATAAGVFDFSSLEALGTLDPAAVRARLRQGGEQSVLIYLYNPVRPLALTGASLEAWATPFPNVTILKAGGEPADAALALVVAGLERAAYTDWNHLAIDRYIAGRIGQSPVTDLRSDLTFGWAYPVYQTFPEDQPLDLGDADGATLSLSWRSQFPDPPPPWSFFLSTDSADILSIEPESFGLSPSSPPQEITLSLNRQGLPPGDYTVTLLIQPFSETFGLIDQAEERIISFVVGESPPTPTPGPTTDIAFTPSEPRQGDTLTLTASGFQPGEPVLVELVGPARTIRDALPTADEDGVFSYELSLDSVPADSYTLRLVASLSGIVAEASVEVLDRIADAVVAQNELNLRIEPSYDSPVLEVLVKGDELTVLAVNGDDSWLEVVTTTGIQGWVVTDLVDLNIDLATIPWNTAYPAP